MSKFCENCGAEMKDEDTICASCSPKASEEVKEVKKEETTTTSKKTAINGNVKKYLTIGGIVFGIIILIAIIISFITPGYEKPIKNYFKALEKGKVELYLSTSPEFLDYDSWFDEDYMEDLLEDFKDEYGSNFNISYSIKKKTKIDKKDLEDIEEEIKNLFDEDVKVTKGYELKVETVYKGRKDKDTRTQKLEVYQMDGKWYIY